MKWKKILNPFIFLYNLMNYFGHLETYRAINENRCKHERVYDPYDFNKDLKYY